MRLRPESAGYPRSSLSTPLVNAFILGSEVYHDYYRWPARDQKVFEDWKKSTSWGRLFDKYTVKKTLAKPNRPASRQGSSSSR